MTDRYNRVGNSDGGGRFMMGLLAGAALGAGLAMLFASKRGAELREQLAEQADVLSNQLREGYRKATENAGQWVEKGKAAAGDWAERGKDLYGKTRDAASHGADEAQKYARDAVDTVTRS
jgi:gas vesicle protein